MKVVILKDIERPQMGTFFRRTAQIDYDSKRPKAKKLHSLFFQQGNHFGSVGDKADVLSHAELLELQAEGFIRIQRG